MIRKKLAGALGAVIVALFLMFPAHHSGAAEKCNLRGEKFDNLKFLANDYSLDYSLKIITELKLRKELLGETVDCAIEEANTVKSDLDSAAVNDSELKILRDQISGQITEAIKYYELRKSTINDLGIQGSLDFANNLASWREGNYKPAARNALNFLMLARNQALLQTAQNRLDQIERAVGLLKIVESGEIQNIWRETQNSFNDALAFNNRAVDDLRTFSEPDETLSQIKSSLESLAVTYQKFFDLVSNIKSALSR